MFIQLVICICILTFFYAIRNNESTFCKSIKASISSNLNYDISFTYFQLLDINYDKIRFIPNELFKWMNIFRFNNQ